MVDLFFFTQQKVFMKNIQTYYLLEIYNERSLCIFRLCQKLNKSISNRNPVIQQYHL